MKPSRELDALVAEKVMGWRVGPIDDDYLASDGTPTGWTKGTCYSQRPPFRPSTDIAAAWEVVQQFDSVKVLKAGASWDCGISVKRGDWFEVELASAPTAPLAICLAALRAVGVEVER